MSSKIFNTNARRGAPAEGVFLYPVWKVGIAGGFQVWTEKGRGDNVVAPTLLCSSGEAHTRHALQAFFLSV
jgi:hypothetical protein